MANEAYATFRHPAVVPLDQIGPNQFVLELFHGPTLAFKDVAMQLISRLMDHVLAKRNAAHHHRGRDLGRYRRRRGRCVCRPRQCRSGRAVPERAHLRRAAADDDDDGRGQRACARDRRHVRRLPGDREGDVQPSRLSRCGLAVGRQLDQLGADRGAGGVLFHLGGRARRARAHGGFHRADREFRRHLCGLRRQEDGPADPLAAHRLQRQRHPAAHAQDRHL